MTTPRYRSNSGIGEAWYSTYRYAFDSRDVQGDGAPMLAPASDFDSMPGAWFIYDDGLPCALLDLKYHGRTHEEGWTPRGRKGSGLRSLAHLATCAGLPAFVVVVDPFRFQFRFAALNPCAVEYLRAFVDWTVTYGKPVALEPHKGSPSVVVSEPGHWHLEMFVRGKGVHDADEVERRVRNMRANALLPQQSPQTITLEAIEYGPEALKHRSGVSISTTPLGFHVVRITLAEKIERLANMRKREAHRESVGKTTLGALLYPPALERLGAALLGSAGTAKGFERAIILQHGFAGARAIDRLAA